MSHQQKVTEASLRRAVQKALKETIKEIKKEPARTIIESDDARNEISEETAGEIMAWLFRMKDNHDSPGN